MLCGAYRLKLGNLGRRHRLLFVPLPRDFRWRGDDILVAACRVQHRPRQRLLWLRPPVAIFWAVEVVQCRLESIAVADRGLLRRRPVLRWHLRNGLNEVRLLAFWRCVSGGYWLCFSG